MSLTAPILQPPVRRIDSYRSPAAVCSHQLGGLPCVNQHSHPGGGRGCIHHSTSGVPDRHDTGIDE